VKKILTTKKRIVIAAGAGVAVLVTGGTAFAFYTSSGSGTGSATAGSAGTTDWGVTQLSSTGTLYPVAPGTKLDATNSATITFTVKNNGSGNEEFTKATPTIDSVDGTSTGDAESGSTPTDIPGCTSGWFTTTVASDPGANTSIAPGGTATVTVTVTMTDEPTTQDACEGQTPDVNLAIS
jgi:hypothetical protein